MPKKPKKNDSLDDINKWIDEMGQREEEKNVFITGLIVERIKEIGKLSPREAQNLAQHKKTQRDIELIFAELKRIEKEQIILLKTIVHKVAETTYNTTLRALNQAENAPNLPPINKNEEVKQVVKEAEKQAVQSFKNAYRTQAFMLRDKTNPKILIPTPLSKAYQKAIDEATHTIITSGERWEKKGKSTKVNREGTETNKVAYESERGKKHTQRLDTAVRRNVLDSVRMVNQNVQNEVGKQFDSDGIEITVHRYPADDHAPVQGHQFTNEEFNKMQNGEDCKDLQGRIYTGFRRPIGMWNCRHFTFSIICGVFPQTYDDSQLQNILDENEKGYTLPNGKHLTMYQCTQQQRKMETEIRYAKEGKLTAEKAGDIQLATQYEAQVTQLLAKYNAFSRACGLKPKLEKTYVSDY